MDNQAKRILSTASSIIAWYNKPSLFFKDITGFNPIPKQALWLDDLNNWDIHKRIRGAGRNCGKTIDFALSALWYTTILPIIIKQPVYCSILSSSGHQAKKLYDYCESYSVHPYIKTRWIDPPTRNDWKFKDGSKIFRLNASTKQVTGEHSQFLVCDEACEIDESLFSLFKGQQITATKYWRLEVGSTAYEKFPDSWFYDYYEKPDEYGFKVYPSISKSETTWNSMEEYLWNKEHAPAGYFKSQFEGIVEAARRTGALWKRDDLKLCDIEEDKTKPDLGRPSWMEGYPVFMGIDFGQMVSPTVVTIVMKIGEEWIVLDCDILQLGMRWEDQEKRIYMKYLQYHPKQVFADSSHRPVIESLRKSPYFLPVTEVVFKADKPRMLVNVTALVEKHNLKIWEGFDTLRYQMSIYTPETKTGDDTIDSLILSLYPNLTARIEGLSYSHPKNVLSKPISYIPQRSSLKSIIPRKIDQMQEQINDKWWLENFEKVEVNGRTMWIQKKSN